MTFWPLSLIVGKIKYKPMFHKHCSHRNKYKTQDARQGREPVKILTVLYCVSFDTEDIWHLVQIRHRLNIRMQDPPLKITSPLSTWSWEILLQTGLVVSAVASLPLQTVWGLLIKVVLFFLLMFSSFTKFFCNTFPLTENRCPSGIYPWPGLFKILYKQHSLCCR